MANMGYVPEKSTRSLVSFDGNVTKEIMQITSAFEMATKGLKDAEDELNKLKISNLVKLGVLKIKQEEEVLNTAISASRQVADEKKRLAEESIRESAKAEKMKRIAAIKEADEEARNARIAAIEEELAEETARKIKEAKAIVEYEFEEREKAIKKELKEAKKRKQKEQKDENKEAFDALFGVKKLKEGQTIQDWWKEREEAKQQLFTGGKRISKDKDGNIIEEDVGNKAGKAFVFSQLTAGLANFAAKLNDTIDSIAGKKAAIDTRLQGLSRSTGGFFGGDSYWDSISSNITGIAGVSPLIKQSALVERVSTMVGQGIAFNVEQRALLQEMSGKIATTFDAANGTLLRLVKIQQQDTTAGRLGMESALTAFLNNMYATTEYMQGLANTVKSNLEEAMSLMTGENALSFEYQIQKWLGSLSSVGMSEGAVSGLAGILGQVAAGKLEGITGGGQGNLVIMAANQAGLSMSDILSSGLDQNTTNVLMNSMVDYLAKIYNESGNSKVIQQQIASVYGLSASDLKAAVNLSKSRSAVARNGLDYNSAMARLYSMADTMGKRTSVAEMMTNMWGNIEYGLSDGIATNPVTYGIYKAGKMLKDLTGGINFGIPLVMGNGMPVTFNIADLMLTGALAGGALGSMGKLVTSGGAGGFTGKSMLKAVGLTGNGISVVTRGNGSSLSTIGGVTTSESGSMVGNSSSDDVQSKTMSDQTDQTKSETASAVDESDEVKLSTVDTHILDILDVLRTIKDGGATLSVRVDNTVQIASGPGGGL